MDFSVCIEYGGTILVIFLVALAIKSRFLYALVISIIGSILFIQRFDLLKIIQLWVVIIQFLIFIPKIEKIIGKKYKRYKRKK